MKATVAVVPEVLGNPVAVRGQVSKKKTVIPSTNIEKFKVNV